MEQPNYVLPVSQSSIQYSHQLIKSSTRLMSVWFYLVLFTKRQLGYTALT